MKTKKDKKYQEGCIPFATAIAKMACINQPEFLVKYFKVVVVSPQGNKLTMTFDPAKYAKEKARGLAK